MWRFGPLLSVYDAGDDTNQLTRYTIVAIFPAKGNKALVNKAELKIVIRRFGVMMLMCCVIPSGIIYFSLDQIVDVWLGDVEYKSAVLLYAKILIPFTIIGALGVIPLSVVTAAGEFSLHAKASFTSNFRFYDSGINRGTNVVGTIDSYDSGVFSFSILTCFFTIFLQTF